MRRFGVLIGVSALLAGLLAVGPAAAGVSAVPANFSAAGFPCAPRGTLPGSPTTNLSTVNVDFATPSNSRLVCFFRGTSIPLSFGGPCQYANAEMTVDFRTRLLLTVNGSATLLCSGGTITINTNTLTTIVSNFNGRDTRTFDSISSPGGTCTNQVEDGVTACTAEEPVNSVATVNLQDEMPFQYTCPGAAPVTSVGAGPYTGSCSVTMDADKTITVVADFV